MSDYISASQSRGETILKGLDSPVHLKISFLLPLGLAFCLLIAAFTYLIFSNSQQQVDITADQTVASIHNIFWYHVKIDSNKLEAVTQTLLQNKDIEAAFTENNRSQLLSLSTPLFQELSKDHGITHFYYHTLKRENLLRVHKPEHYGDIIDRFTMLEAESLGSASSGIELGVLGTFTLRHVSPWYNSNHQLIGYIELGMDLNRIFRSIELLYNTHLYILINKKYLNKSRWIEGMQMLGYASNWDTLDEYVVTNLKVGQSLPAAFSSNYASPETIATGEFNMTLEGLKHRARVIPIADKGNQKIANIWMLIDTDQEIEDSFQLTLIATTVAVTLGLILFALFFKLVTRIELKLNKHQQNIQSIASRDGLTGVYNRRSFDTIIIKEFDRAQRYKRPLSLLILDIDHFKQVNDTFGHIAGDDILKELAKLLSKQLRSSDHLARFGGEEFVVILPETTLEKAHLVANRIRKRCFQKEFKPGEDFTRISVSIGISSFPKPSASLDDLISHADTALYEAKETGRNRVCDFNPESPAMMVTNLLSSYLKHH